MPLIGSSVLPAACCRSRCGVVLHCSLYAKPRQPTCRHPPASIQMRSGVLKIGTSCPENGGQVRPRPFQRALLSRERGRFGWRSYTFASVNLKSLTTYPHKKWRAFRPIFRHSIMRYDLRPFQSIGYRTSGCPVKQFHGVDDRNCRPGADLGYAPQVTACDDLRLCLFDIRHLT